MNMKSLFFSMLALSALASCSNDDNTSVDNTPKTVKISLDYGALTRSIGDAQVAGAPTLSNVQVEFFASTNGTGTALKSEALTDTQMAALNANSGAAGAGAKTVVLIAPKDANSLRLVANNGTTTTVSKSIVDYQNKDVKKAIPYEGVGQISQNGTDAAGKATYAATVALNVAVARVEVSGIITPTGTTTWDKVEVIGVYANNFLATKGESSLFTLMGDAGEVSNTPLVGMYDLKANNTTTWGNAFKEQATLCAGYQYFAGAYGLVLQVSQKKKADQNAVTKFIVIKSFNKSDGDKSQIATLEAGKIYKLDVSSLNDSYGNDEDPGEDKPDGSKSVSVTVNVMQWTVQNVTPNI